LEELLMSMKLLDGVTTVGAGGEQKVPLGVRDHTFWVEFKKRGVTDVTALELVIQGSYGYADADNGVITNGGAALAAGSTTHQIANGAFDYRINGISYHKAAVAAGVAFSEAHLITDTKYGVIVMYIDAAGTLSSRVPGEQAAAQAYNTEALAVAAGDDVIQPHPDTNLKIGTLIMYENEGAQWDGNTDDLVAGSDLTSIVFENERSSFCDLHATKKLTDSELNSGKALFTLENFPDIRYIRAYLSTLTGTAEVTVRWFWRHHTP
jgi:hypothetical protein